MKYSNVYIDSIGYELAPNVITSAEIEKKLEPFYEAFNFQNGQLEALTGIMERRYWDIEHTMYEGAAKAAKKVIDSTGINTDDIGMLIFGGVCRDHYEPATACAVSDSLGLNQDVQVYDVSNACIGVLTGMLQVANAIELGQIKAGLVVSCESARQIVDSTIDRINQNKSLEFYKKTIATMTGGSGAVAVLLTAESVKTNTKNRHKLLGGILKSDLRQHELCCWGPEGKGMPTDTPVVMSTDAHGVLDSGVKLAINTFDAFCNEMSLSMDKIDKTICHQVGSVHRASILNALNIEKEKDFTTFEYLGNMGTVSLPLTAAIADEREFLEKGDKVGFLGIGSGLNCLMLAVDW